MAAGDDGSAGPWGFKGQARRLFELPNSEGAQANPSETAPIGRARIGYDDFRTWIAASIGLDVFRPIFEDAQYIYTFFRETMVENGQFTPVEIDAGLISQPFIQASDLPVPPPTGPTTPAFAIVREGAAQLQLYYWDFIGASGWIGTTYPWLSPVLPPEFVLDQNTTYGVPLGNFQFSFGSEIRIVQACTATDINARVDAVGGPHAFDVRLTTTPGPTAPALTSYTNIVVSGTHTFTTTGWETIATISQPLAVDDWILTSIYGSPASAFFNIPAERSAGNLNENFGLLNAGLFAFVGAVPPGSIAIPTTRDVNNCYGLCTPELG